MKTFSHEGPIVYTTDFGSPEEKRFISGQNLNQALVTELDLILDLSRQNRCFNLSLKNGEMPKEPFGIIGAVDVHGDSTENPEHPKMNELESNMLRLPA